jgi:hypothetical protein
LSANEAGVLAEIGAADDAIADLTGAKRAQVGSTPEGFLGDPLVASLDARGVNLGGEAVMNNGVPVIEKGGALIVAAAIVGPIGEDDFPRIAQIVHNTAKILEMLRSSTMATRSNCPMISAM